VLVNLVLEPIVLVARKASPILGSLRGLWTRSTRSSEGSAERSRPPEARIHPPVPAAPTLTRLPRTAGNHRRDCPTSCRLEQTAQLDHRR
jgi:hypothetical protein